MKEVNGERGAPEILLTGPNQIGFESNFIGELSGSMARDTIDL